MLKKVKVLDPRHAALMEAVIEIKLRPLQKDGNALPPYIENIVKAAKIAWQKSYRYGT